MTAIPGVRTLSGGLVLARRPPDADVDTEARRWSAAGLDPVWKLVTADEAVLLAETADVDEASAAASALGSDQRPVVSLAGRVSTAVDPAQPGTLSEGQALFIVDVATPEALRDDLRAWLHGEHFTHQLATPGLTASRGYEPPMGRHRFVNIWFVDDVAVPSTPDYVHIRATDWYERVQDIFGVSETVRVVGVLERADG